jgi:hypothetical protein
VDIPVTAPSPAANDREAVQDCGLLMMAVVVMLPWTKLGFALPFLCVLATTPRRERKVGEMSQDGGHAGPSDGEPGSRRRLPNEPLKLMGDTASSILERGLYCSRHHVTLLAPLRLGALIHQPPQARTKHTINASWRSAPPRLCGIALGRIPCPSALVLTRDPEGKRPRNARFFHPIKAKQPRRSSSM